MRRFFALIARNPFGTALVLLALSEAAIVEWAFLSWGRPGLGGIGFALTAAAFGGSNVYLMRQMRRLRREGRVGLWAAEAFLLVNLGALFSGPLLLLSLALGWVEPRLALGLGGFTTGLGGFTIGLGGFAIALGFGSILWGYVVGQRRLVVEDVRMPVTGLPTGLEGVSFAHVTDLHIGPQLRAPKLREFVQRINDVGADAIVITGDIFDFDPAYIEEGCLELASLAAPHGVFAVLGNHDVYTGTELVIDGLAKWTSIHVLRDSWTRLSIRDETLYLLGIEDAGERLADSDPDGTTLARVAAEVPDVPARVLLAHRPSYFRRAAELGLPITLSGHTHGGQVSPPHPIQHHNVSRLMTEFTRGVYRAGESLLYVNRGIGVAGVPVRLNCPREIAHVRLVIASV